MGFFLRAGNVSGSPHTYPPYLTSNTKSLALWAYPALRGPAQFSFSIKHLLEIQPPGHSHSSALPSHLDGGLWVLAAWGVPTPILFLQPRKFPKAPQTCLLLRSLSTQSRDSARGRVWRAGYITQTYLCVVLFYNFGPQDLVALKISLLSKKCFTFVDYLDFLFVLSRHVVCHKPELRVCVCLCVCMHAQAFWLFYKEKLEKGLSNTDSLTSWCPENMRTLDFFKLSWRNS